MDTTLDATKRRLIANRVKSLATEGATARCAWLCRSLRTVEDDCELQELVAVFEDAARYRWWWLRTRYALMCDESKELRLLSERLRMPMPELERVDLSWGLK